MAVSSWWKCIGELLYQNRLFLLHDALYCISAVLQLHVATPPKTSIAIISGTGKATDFQIWPVPSEGPSKQKAIKNFVDKGAWAYPGTAKIF